MHGSKNGTFERDDMWREGAWLDLWSVVHILSGVSLAFGLYCLPFGAFASVVLVLLLLISYEMWEMLVQIQETPTNRCMDVVVGMVGFLPTFFMFAPHLSGVWFVLVFGLVVTTNIAMSIFGWRASQKAALLKKRMRSKYEMQRARIFKQREQLKQRFRR